MASAGWPEYTGDGWNITPEYWMMVPHPLFAATGGLPVRWANGWQFVQLVGEFADAGRE